MCLLGNEVRRGIRARRTDRPIDYPEDAAVAINQGIFRLRRLTIKPNFIFLRFVATHKTQFVSRFLRAAVTSRASQSPALNTIAPNLRQHRAAKASPRTRNYRL